MKKWLTFVLIFLPLLALVALFSWGLARSGGKAGGLAINATLGEVAIKEQPAREFTLTLLDGTTLSLSQWRGRVVMVDFWASWCIPCREEAMALGQVYREYKAQGMDVEFVGIDIWDTEKDARDFVRRYSVPYPNGLDDRGLIAVDYGVTGIPEKYFVDRDGILVRKFTGPMNVQQLRAILDGLLRNR